MSDTFVCSSATSVEPARQLCHDLINVLARPFLLTVFGERQLGAENLNTWMVSVMTQSRIIRGSERIIEPMIALAGCSKLQRIIVAGLPNV